MPVAESPSPSVDLVFLAFVGGFALATLVFWPLLHRANTRLGQTSSAPTGKHAQRSGKGREGRKAGAKPAESSSGATAVNVPAGATAVATSGAGSTPNGPSEASSAEGAEAAPPKDLFEERYGPKFDLVRDRLASLRQQINGE